MSYHKFAATVNSREVPTLCQVLSFLVVMSSLCVLQIVDGAKVVKRWYGKCIPRNLHVCEVFSLFSSGEMDNGMAIPEKYRACKVSWTFLSIGENILLRQNSQSGQNVNYFAALFSVFSFAAIFTDFRESYHPFSFMKSSSPDYDFPQNFISNEWTRGVQPKSRCWLAGSRAFELQQGAPR